ncbi:hypothetical protein M0R45_029622 [Rubus argutus]|uniref:Uncharacterized protein n=1 Tax=Rubus argutus TaxID=59490 RepID=A0AAW1WAS8_RUBAR
MRRLLLPSIHAAHSTGIAVCSPRVSLSHRASQRRRLIFTAQPRFQSASLSASAAENSNHYREAFVDLGPTLASHHLSRRLTLCAGKKEETDSN